VTGDLHPDQDTATRVLTDTQLVRWVLRHIRGWSIDRIAEAQAVSKQAVRDSLRSAERAIAKAKQEAA